MAGSPEPNCSGVNEGNCVESVARASVKIQSVIDKAVNSRDPDYSHFISLPLAFHPGLMNKIFNFQNTILGMAASDRDTNPDSGADLGIEKSIFAAPKTFHLTVLMLKLWNKERVKAATEVLLNVSSKVMDALEDRPVMIKLKGLECMRGSLAKAFVLYAPVEEIGGEGRLLRACQVIIDAFVEAGLVMEKDSHWQLTLHATLMNARFRKRRNGASKVVPFDARGIFDLYGSEEWGVYPIREAHLSQRFMYDENGYFHCCASIPFPTTSSRGFINRTAQHAEHPTREADLSQRFMDDKNGNFNSCASISFPTNNSWAYINRTAEHAEHPIREADCSHRFMDNNNGFFHSCASIPLPTHCSPRFMYDENGYFYCYASVPSQANSSRGFTYRSAQCGEYPIHEAHLSQMFMYDENGYFPTYASIPFPTESSRGFMSRTARHREYPTREAHFSQRFMYEENGYFHSPIPGFDSFSN